MKNTKNKIEKDMAHLYITILKNENEFLEKISQSCLANPDNIVEIDLKLRTVKFKDGYIEVFPRRNSRKIEKLINKYNVKKR